MPHSRRQIDAEIRAALREIQSLENATVKDALQMLSRLRERVVLAIAEAGPFTQVVAQEVKNRVATIIQEFDSNLKDKMTENQRRMFTRGIKLVDRAVDAADLIKAVPYLDETALKTAQAFTADLITNLTDDMRGKITSQIQLGVLGQKSATDIIKEVGRNLAGPSVFGTIRRRSEIIVRTEVNRVQALATEARLKQLKARVPDLKQEWLHSGLGQPPRQNHVDMNGVQVAIGEKFHLRAKEGDKVYLITGPYDPTLPVGETVNCRCVAIPVVGRFEKKSSENT